MGWFSRGLGLQWLGQRHFFVRALTGIWGAGGKMLISDPRRQLRCRRRDGGSWPDRRLRSCGALLMHGELEELTGAVVARQQPALVADAQRVVGELMHRHRTAYE